MVEKDGMPISFMHAGVNVHDSKLLEETLDNIFMYDLYKKCRINICLDATYIGEPCEKL